MPSLSERLRNLARMLRARGRAPSVDPREARRMQEDGALVVDVREGMEWRRGHIAGAVNVPITEIESRLAEIPRDRPVVVHCTLGNRGAMAARRLQELGFEDVRNLHGGFHAWKKAGLPSEDESTR